MHASRRQAGRHRQGREKEDEYIRDRQADSQNDRPDQAAVADARGTVIFDARW